MPQRHDVHVPDGDIAYDHDDGTQVFTETQEHRDREIRVHGGGKEIGRTIARAAPEDEDRFRALMETDMRQQAAINEINHDVIALVARIAALELSQAPRNDLYRRLTSRKFLAALFTSIGAIVAALAGFIPAEVAATISAVITALWIAVEGFVDVGAEKVRAAAIKATSTTEKI